MNHGCEGNSGMAIAIGILYCSYTYNIAPAHNHSLQRVVKFTLRKKIAHPSLRTLPTDRTALNSSVHGIVLPRTKRSCPNKLCAGDPVQTVAELRREVLGIAAAGGSP